MFDSSLMAFNRSMHKLTEFVDSITNVWSSKCEILKSAYNLSITSGI
jgi:hypothetical protein